MYNCDYEYDIMAVLRILKFLHLYDPETARRVAGIYHDFGPDDILMFLYEELWNVTDDGFEEYIDDEEIEECILWDKTFEEFVSMTTALCPRMSCPATAAKRKLQDLIMFFFSDRDCGIYDLEFLHQSGRLYVRLILLDGYGEPGGLALAVTDLLHYLHRENERLRAMLKDQEARIVSIPENTMEVAA